MEDFQQPPTQHSSTQILSVERCITELQRGRAIVLHGAGERRLVQPVETLDQPTLKSLLGDDSCVLVLTCWRCKAMGILTDKDHVCMQLSQDTAVEQIRQLSGLDNNQQAESTESGQLAMGKPLKGKTPVQCDSNPIHASFSQAALKLAQFAHILPALVMSTSIVNAYDCLSAEIHSVLQYDDQSGKLNFLGSASIPLTFTGDVKLAVFRERHGSAEHIAITVGAPDPNSIVTVRLHSSCFTGDILGSLRCDCGEQLEGAIKHMADEGGGVVLYVSQEGRGIGLANKLRAYQLQDAGLDTIEANQFLGFSPDERVYSAASTMLRKLGILRLRLMTNNPMKIDALRNEGFEVIERLPSPATVNVHNARYLATKRQKAGHLAVVE